MVIENENYGMSTSFTPVNGASAEVRESLF